MAVHKVPQDVEAEDKLLGPLTFKQFIFMLIAAGSAMIAWLLFAIHPALSVLALPFVLVFAGLAIFRREDQPVERYLLSFFNFLLRPRTRVWNTEGYYEHLIITAPKRKVEAPLKQDLAQVHGQLEKLAQIVDTRGWAAKRPELVVPSAGSQLGTGNDDRLFMPTNDAPATDDITHADDIMDDANPEAAKLSKLIDEEARKQKEQVIKQMGEQKKDTTTKDGHKQSQATRKHTPNSTSGEKPAKESAQTKETTTPAPSPDILELSGELKVSQMAEAVNRQTDDQQLQKGEEISLR